MCRRWQRPVFGLASPTQGPGRFRSGLSEDGATGVETHVTESPPYGIEAGRFPGCSGCRVVAGEGELLEKMRIPFRVLIWSG